MRSYTTLTSSVTGYRKAQEGRPCEDAVKVVRVDGATVMAVADGHGDRRCIFADTGSALAVRAACEVLKRYFKACDAKQSVTYWNTHRDDIAQDIVMTFYRMVIDDYRVRASDRMSDEEAISLKRFVTEVYQSAQGTYTPEQIRERYRRRKAFEERLSKIAYLYGTTIRASVLTSEYIFSLALGDGDTVAVIGDRVEWLLPASVAYECETASLCEDINTVPQSFLFSYTELGDEVASTVADVRQHMTMLVLSTDGFRNSFIGDTLFCDKLRHIATAMCERNRRNTARAVKSLFEKLTMESVFQDDITAVFAVEG